MQIPIAQKDSQVKQIFVLWGSAGVKAVLKHVDEINPRTMPHGDEGKMSAFWGVKLSS